MRHALNSIADGAERLDFGAGSICRSESGGAIESCTRNVLWQCSAGLQTGCPGGVHAASDQSGRDKTKSAAAEAAALLVKFVFRLEGELGRHLQLAGPIEVAVGGGLGVECGGPCARVGAKAALERGVGRSRTRGRAQQRGG